MVTHLWHSDTWLWWSGEVVTADSSTDVYRRGPIASQVKLRPGDRQTCKAQFSLSASSRSSINQPGMLQRVKCLTICF